MLRAIFGWGGPPPPPTQPPPPPPGAKPPPPGNLPPPGLKLEGGSLTGEAVKYIGTYRLAHSKLVNGRPAYQHTSDATRWIAFAGDRWMGHRLRTSLVKRRASLTYETQMQLRPT